MAQRAYRRRPDGVLELVPRRGRLARELVLSAAVTLGGLALTITVAAAVATHVPPSNFQRTVGAATACWNWSAGAASGCGTR